MAIEPSRTSSPTAQAASLPIIVLVRNIRKMYTIICGSVNPFMVSPSPERKTACQIKYDTKQPSTLPSM